MKLAVILLAALAAAAPPPPQKLLVKETNFRDNNLKYTSSHDIVDIAVPVIKTTGRADQKVITEHLSSLFFVEADLKDNGAKDYKGLYIFHILDKEAKKILENGQSVAYGKDFNPYFGAKDGLYKFNKKDITAEKVGNINESIVKMATDTDKEVVYYLTEDHVLYKLDEDEKTSTKVEAVKDARDIVFDLKSNMYFIDGTKQVYVYDGENVVKIEGLPSDLKKVDFIINPFLIQEVYAIVDRSMYQLNKNGTSLMSAVEFEAQPTAYALDHVVYQHYAYNKKLYTYSFSLFDLIGFARSQEN